MIVVDIETSGIDFNRCGIWQIGALDSDNPENTFLEESRIDDEDEILNIGGEEKPVLEVIGKTEEELRDKNQQAQKELLERFFKWCESVKIKNCLCQNPQFDLAFLKIKSQKYGLKLPFHYRAFDLHNIAQTKYFEMKKEFLIKEDHSNMNLTNVLNFCGLKDNRQAHNALEDAKLTAECFSRLINGKSLFQEYSQHEIPENLK